MEVDEQRMDRPQSLSPVERRVEEWKRRLIDLTRRNRLLYFSKTRRSSLTISQPDATTVFQRLVALEKPWKFWLPPPEPEPSSDHPPKQDDLVCGGMGGLEPERKLKNLYRRSRTDYRERGVCILYAAFGLLTWKGPQTTDFAHSPLLLCPIELTRKTARDPYVLSLAEEEVVLNPALQVKLQRDFNIQLPGIPEDWEKTSLSAYLNTISHVVYPLQWSVETIAVIGLFSFHKLVMYQDLEVNASHVQGHAVIRTLATGQGHTAPTMGDISDERQLDAVQKPEETFQILDADSSQQQCIQAALRGPSLVLQGPPGTGKSQTIANIIVEFMLRWFLGFLGHIQTQLGEAVPTRKDILACLDCEHTSRLRLGRFMVNVPDGFPHVSEWME
jgi:hypothetical protein